MPMRSVPSSARVAKAAIRAIRSAIAGVAGNVQIVRHGAARPRTRCGSSLKSDEGHSIIDGKRFDWEKFDNLAVPGGSWFEHINGDEKRPAILFVASDEPALKCFHLFKKWGRDTAGDSVKVGGATT